MKAQFLCLANSWKQSGRCVAGLHMSGSGAGWIRPISNQPGGAVPYPTYVFKQGREASLLDIIEVEVTGACPSPHQPENWMLGTAPWTLVGQFARASAYTGLVSWLWTGPQLFGGTGDRIPYSLFAQSPASSSLVLIKPDVIDFEISKGWGGKRKTRGIFQLKGTSYNLSITDPLFSQHLKIFPDGRYTRANLGIAQSDRILLTVSLGEPLPSDGCCYKL
ncbi:dual OB domain-containing protein, partial [Archangium violaceum]|uniref:dual OB domain-containing protein n=1 Tax=Archangium violaceum TaxID=83451 RepID=UPI003C7D1985